MITTGTKHTLQCGVFTDSRKEWNHVPCINRIWAAWSNHWACAFEEQKIIQKITGGGFSANSTTALGNTEMVTLMATSLNNLAMAAVQKNKTVEKLIDMNNQKDRVTTSLTDSLQAGKQQMENSWRSSHKPSSQPKQCQSKFHKTEEGGITMVTAGATATNAIGHTTVKPVILKKNGTRQEQPEKIQLVDGKPAGQFKYALKLKPHLQRHLVQSLKTTSDCTNLQNLNTTALLNTGASISLVKMGAPADRTKLQTAP
ncbi:hypothetical protein ACHAW6_001771 [Cyclotella cf. meneghiniana]